MARPRQVSDEQVIEAARAVFMEHGPKAPVSMIAGRVGLSDAALFKRFGTKQDLLLAALLPPEVPVFMSLLDAGPVPGDVREQLIEIGTTIAEALGRMIPCLSILHAAGLDHRQAFERYDVPPPIRAQRSFAAWIRAAQEQGAIGDHVDPDTVAMTVMGAMHFRTFLCGVVGAAHRGKGCVEHLPDARQYGRNVIESLWAGIAPRGGAA